MLRVREGQHTRSRERERGRGIGLDWIGLNRSEANLNAKMGISSKKMNYLQFLSLYSFDDSAV